MFVEQAQAARPSAVRYDAAPCACQPMKQTQGASSIFNDATFSRGHRESVAPQNLGMKSQELCTGLLQSYSSPLLPPPPPAAVLAAAVLAAHVLAAHVLVAAAHT